jgi:hypothetical protein
VRNRLIWLAVLVVAITAVVSLAAFGASTSTPAQHMAAGDALSVDCPNKISVEPVDPHGVALNCAADPTTTTVPPTTTVAPTTTTPPTTTSPPTTTAPPTTTTPPTTTIPATTSTTTTTTTSPPPPTTTTTPPPPPNQVDVRTFGAKCDGTTNDTTAIQNAANTASGKSLYFPAGTCRVRTVTVPAGANVTGEGAASIIKQTTLTTFNDPSPVFDALGSNVFSNIKVDGNRVANRPDRWSDSYDDAGRGFKNSTCCGRGRGYRSGIRGESITGLTVDHVELTNIAGAAVATNMSSNVTLSNSNVHDSDFEALYAFGDGAPVANVSGSNVNVTNNTITNVHAPAAAGGTQPDGIVISRAVGGTVTGNTSNNTDRDFLKLEGDQNFTVSGNTASTGVVGYPVLALQPYVNRHDLGSRHIRVTGNTLSGPGFEEGVQINSSSTTTNAAQDIEVDHNTIISGGSIKYGVLADGTVGLNGINIHDNDISGTLNWAIRIGGGGTTLSIQANRHNGNAMPNVTASTFTTDQYDLN